MGASMTVQMRVGLSAIEIVGERGTYREALDLAIQTLRRLEERPAEIRKVAPHTVLEQSIPPPAPNS